MTPATVQKHTEYHNRSGRFLTVSTQAVALEPAMSAPRAARLHHWRLLQRGWATAHQIPIGVDGAEESVNRTDTYHGDMSIRSEVTRRNP